jgi:site-specific recombinase
MLEALFERFVRLHSLADHPGVGAGLRSTFADGFRLLATWTKSQGLSPKLRKRSRPCEVTASPFHRIARLSEAIVDRWLAGQPIAEEAEAWRREDERCREEMAEIHRQIEREGVSTHVVYGLELIERCLTRMAMMLDIVAAPGEREAATALHRLFARLASSVHDDRSVRHLTWWTTHLLQRRIVERSGRTGEHYIANTRSEYSGMFLRGIAGVAVMFVLNLSVSFALALITAARAYELPPAGSQGSPSQPLPPLRHRAARLPAAAAPRPAVRGACHWRQALSRARGRASKRKRRPDAELRKCLLFALSCESMHCSRRAARRQGGGRRGLHRVAR